MFSFLVNADEGKRLNKKKLPREARLFDPALFREAFDQDRSYVTKYFVLWLRSGADACKRLGVIASKKSFPLSVSRSRAKRLIREAYRHHRNKLDAKYDCIMVARKSILKAKMQDVADTFIETASQAGLVVNE